ncbi:MAG: hypothetical protein KJZ84_20990 [Bryobacteraceae bacterium]|nr:hypothetical protein [Bryobacteraceae bacterium]
MLPTFLLEEQVVRANGSGPVTDLGSGHPSLVSLTLGITRVIEQESLDVALVGSADGETWTEKPLLAFPQKFYCGVYTLLLDLSGHPGVRYIRTDWKVSRWGRGDATPLFGFYLFAQPAPVRAMASTAA